LYVTLTPSLGSKPSGHTATTESVPLAAPHSHHASDHALLNGSRGGVSEGGGVTVVAIACETESPNEKRESSVTRLAIFHMCARSPNFHSRHEMKRS
jgi:hypothetical protein